MKYLLATLTIALPLLANAAEIQRPSFTNEGRFYLAETASAQELFRVGNVRGFIFDNALNSCPIYAPSLSYRLNTLLQDIAWPALRKIWPNPQETLGDKQISIFIDDFGERRELFSGFYFATNREQNQFAIVLDCARATQLLWGNLLAHELTHVLLDNTAIDPWLEEGIAQMVEWSAGGPKPQYGVEHSLRESSEIPLLHNPQEVIHGTNAYAMSFLFTRFLHQNFGSWAGISAFLGAGSNNSSCSGTNFEQGACRLQNFLQQDARLADRAGVATAKGLTRYFALALLLNDARYRFASIDGWQGFTALDSSVTIESLSRLEMAQIPGARAELALAAARLPNAEVYAVDNDGGARPSLRLVDASASPAPAASFYIFLNLRFL